MPDETWKLRAACRGMNPSFFFPDRGSGSGQMNAIRKICDPCPVKSDCDVYAEHKVKLTTKDGYRSFRAAGVWAGLSEKQRRARRRANSAASI